MVKKLFLLLIVGGALAVGGYYVYKNVLDPSVKPYKVYEAFSDSLVKKKYDEAYAYVIVGSPAGTFIQQREGRGQFVKIIQVSNEVISKSFSEDKNKIIFVINQRAWTDPANTPPAFPDYSLKQEVELVKTGKNDWKVSKISEKWNRIEM